MYRFKVHCRDKETNKRGKPVFVEIEENDKLKALAKAEEENDKLKARKAYYVCEKTEKEAKKKQKKETFN